MPAFCSFLRQKKDEGKYSTCGKLTSLEKNCLGHGFSTSQMLWPFNTVLHVVVTASHKIALLLLHNCNFATVMSCHVNN